MPTTDSAMTPHRVTRVLFDEPFYDLSQGLWGAWRFYDQIAPVVAAEKGADSAYATQMHFWASGAWGLRPLQMEVGKFAETDPGVTSVLDSSLTTTIPGRWNPGTTEGLTDLFFRKSSADAATAPPSLAPTAKVTSFPTALGTMTVPMDPILKSNSTLAINQGLCVRFVVDGPNRNGYDWIGAILFGQYGLALRGDGQAELWEYGTPVGGSGSLWRKHYTFRFAKPNQVTRNYHQLLFFPHVGPVGEKYIAFASANLDAPQQGSAGLASTPGTRAASGGLVSSESLFRWDEIRSPIQDQAGGGGNVTTAQRLWLLERRNVRCQWQVSNLVFADAGQLVSDFWGAEPNDPRGLSTQMIRTVPTDTNVVMTLRDSTGGTVSAGTPGVAFSVLFDLTGPKTTTPLLWAYKVERSAACDLRTPGSFTVPATNFNVEAATSDPRSEKASLLCEDKLDAYPRLRTRAELPMRIVVTDSSGVAPVEVSLFQGTAISPLRTKFGRAGKRLGMGWGAAPEAPSAQWSQYQVTAAGMWHRLSAITLRSTLSYQDFAYDPSAGPGPQGEIQGWKVTDAIGKLLTVAGFPSSMQNIPSLAMRFRPGIGTADSDRILEPSTTVSEMLVRLCRNYLGRFLVFDPNQGTRGKWTLVGVPSSTTALAHFVGGPTWSPGDALIPVHRLTSYPENTAPSFGRRESYYIAPENNHLVALTVVDPSGTGGSRVDNHLYNYLSYKVPGSTIDPDPDSPHYIGFERAVVLADPALWAGSQIGGWEETQKAVDFVLLRLFAYTCMARQRMMFKAPLLFITDPVTARRRPLRYYDVVTLDGETGWYVRSCNPNYQHDVSQTADYVLERLVEYRP